MPDTPGGPGQADGPVRPGRPERKPPERKFIAWDGFLKRYVWDDDKTPYLVPVDRLHRRQADHEILAYCLFLGVLFSVGALVCLVESGPVGRSVGASFYAFSVVCGAATFQITKSDAAALYLSAAPIAVLTFMYFNGLSEIRPAFDTVLVVFVVLVLVRYSFRVVALARAYPNLPEPEDDGDPRPRRRRMF